MSRHRDIALGCGEHMLIQVPGHAEHRVRWIVSVGRDAEEELRDLGAADVRFSWQRPTAPRAEAMIALLASSASGAEHALSIG